MYSATRPLAQTASAVEGFALGTAASSSDDDPWDGTNLRTTSVTSRRGVVVALMATSMAMASSHAAAQQRAPVSQLASAAPTRSPRTPDSEYLVEPQRRWYGWQTLLSDGASIAIAVIAGSVETAELLPVAGVGILLGAPIVHWAHSHVGKGFTSLGLRAVPALFTLAASSSSGLSVTGMTYSLLAVASLLVVISIDAAANAWEAPRTSPMSAGGRSMRRYVFAPSVHLRRDGATVGVSAVW